MAITGNKDTEWLVMKHLALWEIWELALVNKHSARIYYDDMYWKIRMCNIHQRYLKEDLGKKDDEILTPILPDGYSWRLFHQEVFHFSCLATKTNFKRRNRIGYALRYNKLALIDYFLSVEVPINADCFSAAAETGNRKIIEYLCTLYESRQRKFENFAVEFYIWNILEGLVIGNSLELFKEYYENWSEGLTVQQETNLTESIAACSNLGFSEYFKEKEIIYSTSTYWFRGRFSANLPVPDEELTRFNLNYALEGSCIAGNKEITTHLLQKIDDKLYRMSIYVKMLRFIIQGLVKKIEKEMCNCKGKFVGDVEEDSHINLLEDFLEEASKNKTLVESRDFITDAYLVLGKGARREQVLSSKGRKEYHKIFPNIEVYLNEDPRVIYTKHRLEKLGAGNYQYAMERAIVKMLSGKHSDDSKRKWSNISKWIEEGFYNWNFSAACTCFSVSLNRHQNKNPNELLELSANEKELIDFFMAKPITNFNYLQVPNMTVLKYVIDKHVTKTTIDKAILLFSKRARIFVSPKHQQRTVDIVKMLEAKKLLSQK